MNSKFKHSEVYRSISFEFEQFDLIFDFLQSDAEHHQLLIQPQSDL